jgi:hypothetical protein
MHTHIGYGVKVNETNLVRRTYQSESITCLLKALAINANCLDAKALLPAAVRCPRNKNKKGSLGEDSEETGRVLVGEGEDTLIRGDVEVQIGGGGHWSNYTLAKGVGWGGGGGDVVLKVWRVCVRVYPKKLGSL